MFISRSENGWVSFVLGHEVFFLIVSTTVSPLVDDEKKTSF